MLKKLWSLKVVRFASVGVFNTLLDITILNTLVFAGHVPYVVANLISASISMSISYLLNHRIVFKSKEDHTFKKFAHFFAVTGVGILGIQSLVIYSVKHLLSPHNAAVANLIHSLHLGKLSTGAFDLNAAKLGAVLIAMTWNFIIYHFVIFKKPNEELDEDVLL